MNNALAFQNEIEKTKIANIKYSIIIDGNEILDKRKYPTLPRDLRYLDDFSINPGLGFNSGFIAKITGDFSISAEIIPKLIYKVFIK